ncbi:membrane-associated protein, putative [Bodo saltans]|uniref:Membrane-associated protein, putative n=1 Tax=Bodo saltans TaxID=75058 RepID=A0A0S4JA46_BODSA|nr:membrane-associated protein, putative [Bodo saltans]|eukprot:CUG87138.1 membrane-associated protein, putative [Bodo saltans]
MLRRVAFSTSRRAAMVGGTVALQQQSRHASGGLWNCPCLTSAATDVSAHFTQLVYPSTYTTVAAVAYSPIATLALILLAYNVGVVGAKHCWYTLELTVKDYVQDQQLVAVLRYLLLLTILFSVEALFIES